MYMNRKGIQFGFKDAQSTWNLSKIIHDWLVNFKSHLVRVNDEGGAVGTPISYYPEGFHQSEHTKEEYAAAVEAAWDNWLSDIDKMIFAFDRTHMYEVNDEIAKRVEEGREVFAKMYADLWW